MTLDWQQQKCNSQTCRVGVVVWFWSAECRCLWEESGRQ